MNTPNATTPETTPVSTKLDALRAARDAAMAAAVDAQAAFAAEEHAALIAEAATHGGLAPRRVRSVLRRQMNEDYDAQAAFREVYETRTYVRRAAAGEGGGK